MTGKPIYETKALFQQNMLEEQQEPLMSFYRELFAPYGVASVHDASIGAGGTTLPVARLGIVVSGSDLSENLLSRARENFARHKLYPELFLADFRTVGPLMRRAVDCMMSTGNSLPHVDLQGFHRFLASSYACIREEGLLFFDIRNWDALVKERAPMHAIAPKVMTAAEHRSVYLLFNWHDDGSVTFTFANSTDRNGLHEGIEFLTAPPYYPLLRGDVKEALAVNGFELIRFIDLDSLWIHQSAQKPKTGDFEADFDAIQWYGVLARRRSRR